LWFVKSLPWPIEIDGSKVSFIAILQKCLYDVIVGLKETSTKKNITKKTTAKKTSTKETSTKKTITKETSTSCNYRKS